MASLIVIALCAAVVGVIVLAWAICAAAGTADDDMERALSEERHARGATAMTEPGGGVELAPSMVLDSPSAVSRERRAAGMGGGGPARPYHGWTMDEVEAELLRMSKDPDVLDHLHLGALKQLAMFKRKSESTGSGPVPDDARSKMHAIVTRLGWPDVPELRDAPADPLRGMDWAAVLGHEPDDLLVTWTPYCFWPGSLALGASAADRRKAERIEREIVGAAKRLGVGMGPYDLPGHDDELAKRRRGA